MSIIRTWIIKLNGKIKRIGVRIKKKPNLGELKRVSCPVETRGGGRCIFKRERKGDKFDFAYEKGDVSKGTHILRCTACRKVGLYNVGLNAYQLKKCFDVGLRRMYRLYCIQNFFSPLLNCPSRKIRISLALRRNINNFSKGKTVNIRIIGETFSDLWGVTIEKKWEKE